jgi:hypothetical protein
MHKFIKPENWNELPMYKKIYVYGLSLTPNYSNYVDKLQVKEYVNTNFGDNSKYKVKTAKLVKILKNIDDISQEDIHKNYILKATHGWNMNIFLNNPNITVEIIKSKLKIWNKPFQIFNEPQYKSIIPRFFIEEIVDDYYFGKEITLVYMFRCVFGKVISIGVAKGRHLMNHYDVNWNEIEKSTFNLPKPNVLDKMLNIASSMSKKFEFVRVDLYYGKDNNIYFSEYTFTPSGGRKVYSDDYEYAQAKYW